MASTTTAFVANDIVVKLANAAGTLKDISGSSNKFSPNFDNVHGEFKPFGTEWYEYLQSGKKASISIRAIASETADEVRDLIEAWYFDESDLEPRAIEWYVPDDGAGSYKYSCNVLLKNFKFDGDSQTADPVMYEIELQPTGTITRALIS